MQKHIKLSIDCVNKVKMEKLEEFPDSIFSNVYSAAHMQVGRIMEMTHAQDIDDAAENFCNGNEMSNVISFVGERGMGKSSAMLSFAYFLKQYPPNPDMDKSNAYRFKDYNKDDEEGKKCRFYILPKIDVATLTNESLFDVVLAKMWTDFSEKTAGVGEDSFGFSHTKESFNSIKDAYTLYYKDEKQNKNLTSVRQLQELSRSLALREQFAKLVANFLEYIIADNKIAAKDRYLVIPIDDLDLANDIKMDILEQVRIFLSVPQVIILATVDIEKLSLCGKKKFSDELLCKNNTDDYEKGLVRQYSDRYIAKVLPRNSRIYMPRYGGTEAKNYVLDYDKYVAFLAQNTLNNGEDVDYITYINMITAKHLNLIMRYKDTLSLSAESIRNIVNKLNELWSICKYYKEKATIGVLEWFEKEIIISGNLSNSQANIDFMRKVFLIAAEDCNRFIMDYFTRQNELTNEYKYSYGEMLCLLSELENSGYENKELVKEVIAFYSLQIVKYLEQEQYDDVDRLFVCNDIFSSCFENKHFETIEGYRNIDNLLQFAFKYDIQERNIDNIILQNIDQITDIFKIFLFCDMESVIGQYDFVNSSEIGKEIPGGSRVKQKAELTISPWLTVAYISIDNFFINVIRYEVLFEKYIKWIYSQLEKLLGANFREQKSTGIRSNSLLNKVKKQPACGIEKMRAWKRKYKIERLYDLLPVQDVGVMLGVIDRLSLFGNVWRDIDSMMEKLSSAFEKEFREAEDACAYDEWGYERYSEKFKILLEIIAFHKIPEEIKSKLIVKGQQTEDITRLP